MEGLLLEFAELAERYINASAHHSGSQHSHVDDVADLDTPLAAVPEKDAFRKRLSSLTEEEQAALLATFWLGRGHSRPSDYPPLLEHARRSLDNLASYFLDKASLAPALRRGAAILRT